MSKHKSCLVLNGDYTPIGIIDWQKSIIWSYRYHSKDNKSIDILEYHENDYVQSVSTKVSIPAVIKTVRYYKLHNSVVNFSRKNLFIRDNYTCQYCGCRVQINNLTYDHVIPKSQWISAKSPTTWTNIVTACRQCNIKKGNKTPSQANMNLKNKPYIPKKEYKYLPIHSQLHNITEDIPKSWLTYIR